jgi:hypothetical protein
MRENAAASIATGAGWKRRNPKMLIFTLVDEVAVTMDACGANTRTLDNHHSHDSNQGNIERLTGRGQVETR